MFENLTEREKKLALAVAGLLPLALIFIIFVWMGSELSQRSSQRDVLIERRSALNKRKLVLQRAQNRHKTYLEESLPANVSVVLNQYQLWLSRLGSETFKLDGFTATPAGPGQQVKYGQSGIRPGLAYTAYPFKVDGQGNIRQLTEFLHRFRRAKVLQRIKSITIIPIDTGTGASQARSDKLILNMSVEVLQLPQADADRDFEEQLRNESSRTLEQYLSSVAYRDIFGPVNEPPKLQSISAKNETSGQSFSFPVRTTENDSGDLLKYELIESDVPGARLVHNDPKNRTANLQCPGLDQGTYQFKVRVTDNGCPPKFDEARVTVNVRDEQPRIDTASKPKPQMATETYISSLWKVNDKWVVWIQCRPTGEESPTEVGESFQLDEKTWTIVEVKPPHIIIEVEGEKRVYQEKSRLSEPIKLPQAGETPIARGDRGIK